MTGLFMLAFSFALNTDTQKPHTHVFTSHMVVIVHHVGNTRSQTRGAGNCEDLSFEGALTYSGSGLPDGLWNLCPITLPHRRGWALFLVRTDSNGFQLARCNNLYLSIVQCVAGLVNDGHVNLQFHTTHSTDLSRLMFITSIQARGAEYQIMKHRHISGTRNTSGLSQREWPV
jgi:hypothetical protein